MLVPSGSDSGDGVEVRMGRAGLSPLFGIVALVAVGVALVSCATTSGLATRAEMPGPGTVAAPAADASSAAASIDGVVHIDACSLLTQKEAEALADYTLQAAVGAGDDHGKHTECIYTRDPYAAGTAQVTLLVGDGAEKAFHIDRDTLHHKFTTVPAVGDEAWLEDDGIFLRVGANWAAVELVLLNDPTTNVKRLQQAAKIAAGRM